MHPHIWRSRCSRGDSQVIPGRSQGWVLFLHSYQNRYPLSILNYQAQSDLIIPYPLTLSSLQSVIQEIVGFFIIESHVLATTGNFRSERDVEELWEALVKGLTTAVENTLRNEKEPDSYLRAKEILLGFVMTLEVRVRCTATHLISLILDCLSRTPILPIACILS